MRLIIILFTSLCFVACSSENSHDLDEPVGESLIIGDANFVDSLENPDSPSYSFEVFETPGLGWGYKIFTDGTLFINQPHIPAIQGNKGFSSKEKAEVTAGFAILKMEQGFVPPTISQEELDSLGVLN